MITIYILNATLLLLHEIESAYEKEWEMLRLPGKISGFVLIHVPIILLFFYGLLALQAGTRAGMLIALVCGLGGMVPLFVHKVFLRRADRFNRPLSDVLIYANLLSGAALALIAVTGLV